MTFLVKMLPKHWHCGFSKNITKKIKFNIVPQTYQFLSYTSASCLPNTYSEIIAEWKIIINYKPNHIYIMENHISIRYTS